MQPFVLEVPDAAPERHGRVDLYLPEADAPRPAIVFVHGGPVPADATPTPRDWPVFRGYGALTAQSGAVAVVVDHRLHSPADYPLAAGDVADAIDLARSDPRVAADRIAVWCFSGGGLLLADWLREPPPWLRCLAATYPALVARAGREVPPRFLPVEAVGGAAGLPFVLTRVGREAPDLAEGVERFIVEAERAGLRLELVDVPNGRHGFDMFDHSDESRAAVRQALSLVLANLG